MDRHPLKHIIEAALLTAGKPLSMQHLQQLLAEDDEEQTPLAREFVQAGLDALAADLEDRGIELKLVASGYRLQVRQSLEPWIAKLFEERPPRYSRALLETLALIGYRQPITRAEIEDVRGVSVSSNIIRTLLEREWIKVVGHRDVPGRPSMYGTTKQFLDYFNLKSLAELPELGELMDLDKATEAFDQASGADAANDGEQGDAETADGESAESEGDSQSADGSASEAEAAGDASPGEATPGETSSTADASGVDASGVDVPGVDAPGVDAPGVDTPVAATPESAAAGAAESEEALPAGTSNGAASEAEGVADAAPEGTESGSGAPAESAAPQNAATADVSTPDAEVPDDASPDQSLGLAELAPDDESQDEIDADVESLIRMLDAESGTPAAAAVEPEPEGEPEVEAANANHSPQAGSQHEAARGESITPADLLRRHSTDYEH